MNELSPRERVLTALLNALDGLTFDEVFNQALPNGHPDSLEVLLRSLGRNRLVVASHGRWYHGACLDSLSAHRQREKRKRKEFVAVRGQVKHDLDMKLRVLGKLAEITETSISNLLEQIRDDLRSVANSRL